MRKKKAVVNTEVHLSDLAKGQIGVVTTIHNDSRAVRKRLLDMGITQGVEILVVRKAPLGDPVDLLLRGYELCLRKSDMQSIHVRVVK